MSGHIGSSDSPVPGGRSKCNLYVNSLQYRKQVCDMHEKKKHEKIIIKEKCYGRTDLL